VEIGEGEQVKEGWRRKGLIRVETSWVDGSGRRGIIPFRRKAPLETNRDKSLDGIPSEKESTRGRKIKVVYIAGRLMASIKKTLQV